MKKSKLLLFLIVVKKLKDCKGVLVGGWLDECGYVYLSQFKSLGWQMHYDGMV